jgi:hypothetical protein
MLSRSPGAFFIRKYRELQVLLRDKAIWRTARRAPWEVIDLQREIRP